MTAMANMLCVDPKHVLVEAAVEAISHESSSRSTVLSDVIVLNNASSSRTSYISHLPKHFQSSHDQAAVSSYLTMNPGLKLVSTGRVKPKIWAILFWIVVICSVSISLVP